MGPNGTADAPAVPGVTAVVDWLGGFSFHDFELLALPESDATNGNIQIRGWKTEWHATDERGHFRRSKFCSIGIELGGIRRTTLSTDSLPAIIFALEIVAVGGHSWRVEWTSSYGVEGAYEVQTVSLSVTPEDRAGSAGTARSRRRRTRS